MVKQTCRFQCLCRNLTDLRSRPCLCVQFISVLSFTYYCRGTGRVANLKHDSDAQFETADVVVSQQLTVSIISLRQYGVCVSRSRWPAVDFEAASANCEENQTALTLALEKKDAAAVEQLLELNADPNEAGRLSSRISKKPFAVVMFDILYSYPKSVSDSDEKFLELLKQHGADVNATQYGKTALGVAAKRCRVEAVELLLKLKADPSKGEQPAKDLAKVSRKCQTPEEKQRLMAAFKDK